MTISKETQELIISALMKNASLFSVVKDEITDGYGEGQGIGMGERTSR